MLKRTVASLVGVLAVCAASAAAAGAHTYYVSELKGKDSNPCTAARPCKTISHGVAKAHGGDTVMVEAGTYSEDVSITKDIRVIGVGDPVDSLNAAFPNGFVIKGAGATRAELTGFIVQGAIDEGILAENTSFVTISSNIVRSNDQGAYVAHPTGECAGQGNVPGDCGEGIHLMHVEFSKVSTNRVYRNTGGILLTDETGPTAFNTISGNRANKNLYDCGITLAGHNPNAVSSGGKGGGVYDNKITANTVNRNGTLGEGAGILMASGTPGGGVWGNLVKDNTASHNGLAGVTIHAHAPNEDLNGNRIIGNTLIHNGVNDKSEAEFGENDGMHNVTVDILIGSDVVELHGIVVRGNLIEHAHYGVFTKHDATKVRKRRNRFVKVAVKIKQT